MKKTMTDHKQENCFSAVEEDAFLSVEEAAAFLKVKPDTIYAWTCRKRIPFRKHGSRLVFSKKELNEWSQAQAVRHQELKGGKYD